MKRGLLLEEMTVRQEVNYTKLLSSPARGTWVEIPDVCAGTNTLPGRLPHGGRGLKFLSPTSTVTAGEVVSRTGDVG